MQQIRVLFDIGNSRVKMALACPDGLLDKAQPLRLADLSAAYLREAFLFLLSSHDLQVNDLTGVLLCSVVPELEVLVSQTLAPLLVSPLYVVPRELAVPLSNHYEPAEALGSDRLVEAYAARRLFPSENLIVVDLGTAITIDCVAGESFLGGLILPGPTLARQSLARATAQLPKVSFPEKGIPFRPGQNTETCIQTGLFWGLRAMVRALVEESRQFLGGQAMVIGTGGFAKSCHDLFDAVRADLVLEGLRLLPWQR